MFSKWLEWTSFLPLFDFLFHIWRFEANCFFFYAITVFKTLELVIVLFIQIFNLISRVEFILFPTHFFKWWKFHLLIYYLCFYLGRLEFSWHFFIPIEKQKKCSEFSTLYLLNLFVRSQVLNFTSYDKIDSPLTIAAPIFRYIEWFHVEMSKFLGFSIDIQILEKKKTLIY